MKPTYKTSIIKSNILLCQKCKKPFYVLSEDHCILDVELSPAKERYHYCSRNCMEKVFEDIETNPDIFTKVVISNKEIISERNPRRIGLVLKKAYEINLELIGE